MGDNSIWILVLLYKKEGLGISRPMVILYSLRCIRLCQVDEVPMKPIYHPEHFLSREDLRVGMTVKIKHTEQYMVIEKVLDTYVLCAWFTVDSNFHRDHFPISVLELYHIKEAI